MYTELARLKHLRRRAGEGGVDADDVRQNFVVDLDQARRVNRKRIVMIKEATFFTFFLPVSPSES